MGFAVSQKGVLCSMLERLHIPSEPCDRSLLILNTLVIHLSQVWLSMVLVGGFLSPLLRSTTLSKIRMSKPLGITLREDLRNDTRGNYGASETRIISPARPSGSYMLSLGSHLQTGRGVIKTIRKPSNSLPRVCRLQGIQTTDSRTGRTNEDAITLSEIQTSAMRSPAVSNESTNMPAAPPRELCCRQLRRTSNILALTVAGESKRTILYGALWITEADRISW